VFEIFGPESSGKTTLALQVNAQAQATGAAFIDAEHALDANYARKLGVGADNLVVSQPDYGERRSRSRGRWSDGVESMWQWSTQCGAGTRRSYTRLSSTAKCATSTWDCTPA
jgi:hypothetical protein